MKKLYRVQIRHDAVVWANSAAEAREFMDEIVDIERPCVAKVMAVNPEDLFLLPPDWTPSCCVYCHDREGMTVQDCADVMLKRADEQETPREVKPFRRNLLERGSWPHANGGLKQLP